MKTKIITALIALLTISFTAYAQDTAATPAAPTGPFGPPIFDSRDDVNAETGDALRVLLVILPSHVITEKDILVTTRGNIKAHAALQDKTGDIKVIKASKTYGYPSSVKGKATPPSKAGMALEFAFPVGNHPDFGKKDAGYTIGLRIEYTGPDGKPHVYAVGPQGPEDNGFGLTFK